MGNSNKSFDVMIYTLLILATLAVALPVLYVLVSSFSSRIEVMTRGFYLIPRDWSLDAYKFLIYSDRFTGAFKNAVHITVVGTLINVGMSALMAYGLSKRWLLGRRGLNLMVVITIIFQAGIIPLYLVIQELGLYNSYWAIWLSTAIAPFYLVIMRSFFIAIPDEIEEAARIDGCSEWRMLLSVIFPLSKPMLATFTLFYMVHNWNTYFYAIMFVSDADKHPLQVFLRQMLVVDDSQMGEAFADNGIVYSPTVKMAAVMVTAVPMLVVYPFLQKHFNKGMLLGSVKG